MPLSDTRNDAADSGPEITTIRSLLLAVGSPMLNLLAAPRGIDRAVSCTVLYDPTDELSDEPDAVLLISGLRPDEPRMFEVIRTASDCGYCAVIVKRRGAEIGELISAASVCGMVVLAAADEVPWRHLDALLLSALGSHGATIESTGAGDELFALANAIAAVIGGSVAIEDMNRRVIAYSSLADQRIDALREQGILDRRVPDMARNLAQYRSVLASNGVVRFPDKIDEFARAAVAIKAGDRPLGTIWAIEGTHGVDADGERTLIEGANLAALKILRSQNASGLEFQLREAALMRALDGSLTSEEIAFRLSLPGGADLVLIGFAAAPDTQGSMPLITHVASALTHYLAAYRPDAAVTTTSRTIYILLPAGGVESAKRFATGALTATRQAFGEHIRAAIAYSSTDPAELPGMRREIDDILRVTTAGGNAPGAAVLADVRTDVLLAHLGDMLAHEPRLRHGGVQSMLAWDAEHGTEYAASVRSWLDAVGDVATAAGKLDVHPNTLRYRLRRALELFDLDLDDSDVRLSVWMQLRLAAR